MTIVNEITPKEVEQLIENNTDIIIIDVREDKEVATGIINVALHIPLQQIPEEIANLDKEKEYIIVCRSGARSQNATLYMEEHGFNVSNMVGGMLEWKGEVII